MKIFYKGIKKSFHLRGVFFNAVERAELAKFITERDVEVCHSMSKACSVSAKQFPGLVLNFFRCKGDLPQMFINIQVRYNSVRVYFIWFHSKFYQ